MTHSETLLAPNEHVLSTLEADGSRRWLHPRLAAGRFLTRRRIVAYLLIAVFTVLPFLRIGGKPSILLDITARRFTLLGITFLPTDTVLLALFMVSLLLTVFLVTALLGRVWCGWGCPQTVYMEFVFRPIERLCLGRRGTGGKPRDDIGGWRYGVMYLLFLVVSLYLAHTFLSYFVGVQRLRTWMTESPADHWMAFLVVVVVTGAMMFNFAFFREQLCTIACPYGRFQSVLLDRQSLIISYDRTRGEPRGKVSKTSLPVLGDCIDCKLCVAVCPTGIDIRDGLQLECVGCAQCIDACDGVMSRIKRPLGLIRYSSQASMAGEKQKLLRPRVIIYPALICAIVGLLTVLLLTRSPVDVMLLRGLGRPYFLTTTGDVENTMRLKVTNRSDRPQHLCVEIPGRGDIRVTTVTQGPIGLMPGQSWTEPLQLVAPSKAFTLGVLNVTLRVKNDDGVQMDQPCRLLGPMVADSGQR
jgi:cytochrome c oxidase accessory protein FixG